MSVTSTSVTGRLRLAVAVSDLRLVYFLVGTIVVMVVGSHLPASNLLTSTWSWCTPSPRSG